MMNSTKRGMIPLVCAVMLGACPLANAESADRVVNDPGLVNELNEQTFLPLFDALREGDLAALKRYLRPDVYAEYKTLFEQNTEYGQFLRDYYAGTTFELARVLDSGNEYVGEVTVYWPDGRSSTMELGVTRRDARGNRAVSPAEPN